MNLQLLPEEVMAMASFKPDEQRVVVIADSISGREKLIDTARALNARVLFEGDLEAGTARVAEGFVGEGVLVDLAAYDDPYRTVLLAALADLAGAQNVPVLVNSVVECIDEAALWLDAPNTVLMSNASPADWIGAFALTQAQRGFWLHEVATENNLRLQRLADEVDRIARTLSDLAGTTALPMRGVSDAAVSFRAQTSPLAATFVSERDVRAVIKLRRMRDRFFPADLFADPAWDMLLDLMAARLGGIRVAVSSLCIASAVPPTTALRWIKTMTDSGIFLRVADPDDGRRIFLELSEATAEAVIAFMMAAKAEGGLAI